MTHGRNETARNVQETTQAAPVGGWGRISGRVSDGDDFEAGRGGFALLGCGGGRSILNDDTCGRYAATLQHAPRFGSLRDDFNSTSHAGTRTADNAVCACVPLQPTRPGHDVHPRMRAYTGPSPPFSAPAPPSRSHEYLITSALDPGHWSLQCIIECPWRARRVTVHVVAGTDDRRRWQLRIYSYVGCENCPCVHFHL